MHTVFSTSGTLNLFFQQLVGVCYDNKKKLGYTYCKTNY